MNDVPYTLVRATRRFGEYLTERGWTVDVIETVVCGVPVYTARLLDPSRKVLVTTHRRHPTPHMAVRALVLELSAMRGYPIFDLVNFSTSSRGEALSRG